MFSFIFMQSTPFPAFPQRGRGYTLAPPGGKLKGGYLLKQKPCCVTIIVKYYIAIGITEGYTEES
jgi:hypothetical protein